MRIDLEGVRESVILEDLGYYTFGCEAPLEQLESWCENKIKQHANASKRQYLGCEPFTTGLKLINQCRTADPMTDAALTLLAQEWSGDLAILLGDYFTRDACYDRPGLVILCNTCPYFSYEYVLDQFVDVAGMFTSARGKERCLHDEEYHGQDNWYG